MLHRIFLSIRSDYPSEAFYQLFIEADNDYSVPFKGKEEWLNSENSFVEVELDSMKTNMKIGFRRRASYAGDWIAEPVKIDTSKAVVLTEDGKIIQVDAALLQMGRLTDANFLDSDKMRPAAQGIGKLAGGVIGKLIKDSGLSEATKGIISNIPYAGIISALASVIWPEPSVSSLINGAEIRMRNLIITQIRQLDLASQKGSLAAIRDNLEEYKNAKGSGRRRWMDATLSSFNLVKNIIISKDKEYSPGSVYLALDLAGLHLGMLRERINFEKEIFGEEEVDTARNVETLVNVVKEYQDYLEYGCEQEMKERKSQIKVSYKNSVGLGPKGLLGEAEQIRILIRDNVRRQIHRFSSSGSFNSFTVNVPSAKQIEDAQFLVDMYFEQVENELALRLAEDIRIPSKLLDWFIPGKENTKPIPEHEVIVGGPLTGLLLRDFNHPVIKKITYLHDKPGVVKLLQVINLAGAMIPNFGYDAGKGKMRFSMGESSGDSPFTVFEKVLSAELFITKVESWWDRYPRAIRFTFSDGTDSGRLGSKSGGEYQFAGGNLLGVQQDFLGKDNEARKYGFSLMSSFYNL